MRYALAVAWLTGLWVLLWRDASPANLVLGLVVAAAVVALFGPTGRSPQPHRVRPLAALRFLGYFAVKLVEANLVLAREVVTPQNVIQTGIVAVPMEDCSELVITIVANAVSLTPGTLTVEVGDGSPTVLYVHVLHLHDIESARADVHAMTARVRRALDPQAPKTGDRS